MRTTRTRIAKSIYRDGSGLAATVHVGTRQKERRFAPDTPLKEIRKWQEETRAQLKKARDAQHGGAPSGTLAADADRYLKMMARTLTTLADRTYQIQAWLPKFGTRQRWSLTTRELTAQLWTWRETLSASSVNHRKFALSNLFRILDGRSAVNPVLDCPTFEMPGPTIQGLPLPLIDRVIAQVQPGSKTRLRLELLRWTGMRPSQLGRVTADSFDFDGPVPSVLVPRGKRGRLIRVPLMPEALAPARALVAGRVFGAFSNASVNKALALACRKAGVPVFTSYKIKHSVGKRLRESGMDLADIQDVFGHANPKTTAIYAPPVTHRLVDGFQALRQQRA